MTQSADAVSTSLRVQRTGTAHVRTHSSNHTTHQLTGRSDAYVDTAEDQ